MQARDSTLDAIVRRAQSLEPDERIAFVRSACGSDEGLFSDALRTLQSGAGIGWPDDEAESMNAEDGLIGSLIGHYRVIALLGAGGMGRVLLAERADEQFTHKVAIKLVRSDLISKQVQYRLRMERQILATLDHPNIAKLLDGGTHAGVPYIVMEYIEGKPIDVFCNDNRLTIRQRLDLFRTVCSAIHYAHQNLIVHRDIKPSNILVSPDGIPKLLDFGIAKLLDSRQMAHTLALTHLDSRMMTPDHASPEQVRGEPITTASDTYVLGVLLYELLTGRKPLAQRPERLSDLERAICEEPPPQLTLGLRGDSVLPETFLREICEQRSTTPGRLRKELSDDLESIVAMALRKEPERRYSSVEHFSNDIGRFLDGLPILARRDTWAYRTKKFVRRHAIGVGMGTLAIVMLSTFAIVTTVQSRRIDLERAHAEEVSTFLVDMFEQADPEQSRGNEITVKELLDTASRRLHAELDSQPTTKSRLLATLGSVYGKLGAYDEAERTLRDTLSLRRSALPPDDPQIADAERRLAEVLIEARDLAEVEPLLQHALSIYRNHADRAHEYAKSVILLGWLRSLQDRLDESASAYAESVRLLEATEPVSFPALVSALNNWASLLVYRKDYAASERTYRKAARIAKSHLGKDHPDIARATEGLAVSLAGQTRYEEAEPFYTQAIDLYRNVYGNEHPRTAHLLSNYGNFLRRAGKLPEAESALRQALHLQTALRGSQNVETAYSRNTLALVLLEAGRAEEARREFEQALAVYERALPADHQYIGATLLGLSRSLIELRQPREAGALLARAETIATRQYASNSLVVQSIHAAQGGALLSQDRLRDAEPLLRNAYPVLLLERGPADSFTKRVHTWITALYEKQGRQEQAAEYFASLSAK